MKRGYLVVAVLTAGLLGFALRAHATFHLNVIQEAFFGFPQAPQAQYLMLRTLPVQTVVHGQPFPVFDASGPLGSFATFCETAAAGRCDLPKVSPACPHPADCPSALQADNRRVLAATLWAQGLFCVTADLLATATLPYPNGRACFGDCDLRADCGTGPVDCVGYGDFPASTDEAFRIFGNPAPAPPLGGALVGSPDRTNQFIGGNLLDSALGFTVGLPTPQNFHGDIGKLDGLAGDPEGTGQLETDDIDAEVDVLFEADRRCALAPARRGADANFDTRINAADLVATIKIVTQPEQSEV